MNSNAKTFHSRVLHLLAQNPVKLHSSVIMHKNYDLLWQTISRDLTQFNEFLTRLSLNALSRVRQNWGKNKYLII